MKKLSRTCANGVSLRNWVRRGMRAVKVLIFLSSLAGGGTTERDCDARPTAVRSTPGLVAVRAPRDRLRSSAAESSDDAVVSDAIGRGPGHVGFIVFAPDPCGAPEGGRKPIGREELGALPSASRTLRISLRSSSWPRNFSECTSTRWRSSTLSVSYLHACDQLV